MLKRKLVTIGILFCLFINSSALFAQMNRGVGVRVKGSNGQTTEVKLYDASYALVIGNSNYQNWDVLNGVKSDVFAVEKALTENGFKVETAMDLDSRNLSQRIEKFVQDYGYEENNRLLIYYAGHGFTQKSVSVGDDREIGFIVPIDAPLPSKDKIGFLRKAVELEQIRTFAKKIQAKHALFIFDSCFSGKLVSRGEIAVPPIIQESVAFPVRQFITAGSANQSVPDESIFRRAFIRGIEGEADLNGDGFVLASELASFLRDKVTNLSHRTQTPLYAKIDDISLDRGDFVFVVGRNNNSGSTNSGAVTAGTLISNSLGMKLMGVPAGSFQMGNSDDRPIHTVTLSQGFYMGRTEVTQGEWKALMGSLPTKCDFGSLSGEFVGDNKPIICVSWEDAQEFIRKLNAKGEGTYRLPTEAEWEYACRAGTTGEYAGDVDSMGWYDKNSGSRTHEVAIKQPNGWGLYDMHGNVWEWVEDWYGDYPSGSVSNPTGAASGSARIIRGGSWSYSVVLLRSAVRGGTPPSGRSDTLGFRVVRN